MKPAAEVKTEPKSATTSSNKAPVAVAAPAAVPSTGTVKKPELVTTPAAETAAKADAATDVEVPEPTDKPQLTKAEKLAKLRGVFAIEDKITDFENKANLAREERNAAVKALVDAMGTGPWTVDNQLIRARVRGDNAYLLRPGHDDAEALT
jgi:hypothetical protein